MTEKRALIWFGAFVLVVAVAGVAGGVLVERFLLHGPGRTGAFVGDGRFPGGRGMVPPGGAGLTRGGGGLVEQLNSELKLKDEQRKKVTEVIEKHRGALDRIRTELQGRMQSEQQSLQAEIRGLLDPEQQKKFDDVMSRSPRGFGRGLGGPGDRGERGGRRGGPGGI